MNADGPANPAASRRAMSSAWPYLPVSSRTYPRASSRSGSQGSWKAYMYQDFRPCTLVAIALRNAIGCGTDTAVRLRTLSGYPAASAHATPAPQSCPTTCARPPASWSITAAASAASSGIR